MTDNQPDVLDDGPAQSPARSKANSSAPTILTAVLAVLLIAGIVFAVQQYSSWRDHQAAQTDRKSALAAATQFALRMDNFKGDDLDAYSTRVKQLLTTRGKTKFDEAFPAFTQVYEKGKAVSEGEVKVAGIQDIDPDSATALVIHDRLVKSDYGDQQQYLRWTVDLNKVDGKWLVDDFSAGQ